MCLETSKQSYSFLKALKNAGETGLTFGELVNSMKEVSIREFGSDLYVMAPLPLMSILREHEELDGIAPNGRGGYRLTDTGSATLSIVNRVAIQPRRERQSAQQADETPETI